jgi:hypothetical protein
MSDEDKKLVITDIFGIGKLASHLFASDLHVLIITIGICVGIGAC